MLASKPPAAPRTKPSRLGKSLHPPLSSVPDLYRSFDKAAKKPKPVPRHRGTLSKETSISKEDIEARASQLKVRRVNGEEIRNHGLDAQEFGNFATHLQFDFIPMDTVFIDANVPDEEVGFLVMSAAAQLEAHSRGENASDSYEYGLTIDRAERERDPVTEGWRPYHDEVPADVYVGEWLVLPEDGSVDGVRVWIVDGIKVRNMYKTDFVEGGHSYVYPFIPEDEIWIDNQTNEEEWPLMALHEFTERTLMKHGRADYDHAHEVASHVEFAHRPDFSKEELLELAPYILQEMAGGKEGCKSLTLPQSRGGFVPRKSLPRAPKTSESLRNINSEGNLFGLAQITPNKKPPQESLDSYTFDSPESRTKSLDEPHKFSSTQFNLKDAGYSRRWGPPVPKIIELQRQIDNRDLAGRGKESNPHITALYGLHTDSQHDVREAIRDWLKVNEDKAGGLSIVAKLGPVNFFPASETGEYDVVYVEVESEQLCQLKQFLADRLEHTDTHARCKPHITLAYVKPGAGESYVGGGFSGEPYELYLHELIFSNRSRKPTSIDFWRLSGKFDEEPKGSEEWKSLEPPHVKESYFGECERDGLGHCLPKGQGGIEHREETTGVGSDEAAPISSKPPVKQTSSDAAIAKRNFVHRFRKDARPGSETESSMRTGDAVRALDMYMAGQMPSYGLKNYSSLIASELYRKGLDVNKMPDDELWDVLQEYRDDGPEAHKISGAISAKDIIERASPEERKTLLSYFAFQIAKYDGQKGREAAHYDVDNMRLLSHEEALLWADSLEDAVSNAPLKAKGSDLDFNSAATMARVKTALFNRNFDVFLSGVASDWAIAHSSDSKEVLAKVCGSLPVNEGKNFWQPVSIRDKQPPLFDGDRVSSHVKELKKMTEDFYKKKLKGKLDTPLPVLRGVSGAINTYMPASMESWTTDSKTAQRFGVMMGKLGRKVYTILKSTTTYNDVLFSYESMKKVPGWPPEKDLKGKKEFVVLGGGLAAIEGEVGYV